MMRNTHNPSNRLRHAAARLPLTAAIYLALSSVSMASADAPAPEQQADSEDKKAILDKVTVTAQKRTENLQEVPISIQVLGNQKLTEMNVSDFDDYAKLLPSLAYTQGEGGSSTPYFRGVVSGGDGNHSASSPSVGVYLDEQPVTTIGGALDVHIYDIERVEALAGPQATLYGASSQSGTLKIITNKPDPSGFAAGYALEANTVTDGGNGSVIEGFINIPLTEKAAVRVVAWDQKDAGWIDNVYGERTFPTSGITMNNADLVEKDYNDSHTTGARAALKVNLGENWSIMPSIMHQREKTNGSFAYDPVVGEREITRYYPESLEDKWTQASLTVTGKVGNFDLVYAYSHLDRDIDSESDYNDYGFWYDVVSGYGYYAVNDSGDYVNPSQYIQAADRYKKTSHEIRIASPQDKRFRFIGGFFMQDQSHDIQQRYLLDDLTSAYEVPGWDDTIWLTKQDRRDSEKAVFGEFSYDATDKLTMTAGFRYFESENSLRGFFGFGAGFSSNTGEAKCKPEYGSFSTAPCVNLSDKKTDSGTLGKFNLTYKVSEDALIYATWSEGYRPGGVNRRNLTRSGRVIPPYEPDVLTNLEFGWKSSWLDNRLNFNGAIFRQSWDDFQFSFLGENGLTEIRNAAQAEITGLEMDVAWAASYNLSINAGVGFYDGKLTKNYCALEADGSVVYQCSGDDLLAESGTRLPVTAKFKGNLTARYTFDWKEFEPFIQGSFSHEGKRTNDLRIIEGEILGTLPSYTVFDLSAGIRKDNWTLNLYVKNLFDENAQFNRFTMCPEQVCGAAGLDAQYPNGQVYTVAGQPRTIGLRFSQEF
jgi:iron complex outermembrane recepter protein